MLDNHHTSEASTNPHTPCCTLWHVACGMLLACSAAHTVGTNIYHIGGATPAACARCLRTQPFLHAVAAGNPVLVSGIILVGLAFALSPYLLLFGLVALLVWGVPAVPSFLQPVVPAPILQV